MAAKTDQWVRLFDVSESKRHPKGYTIYKVKSTVFPRSQPQASTSVTVWRRYSEIRSLHKSITSLHQKIGLTIKPPPFPSASILNRFEEEVVETRRLAALELFRYIGQHNPLFTSEVFTKFIENENSGDLNISNKKQKVSKQRCLESEALASTLGLPEEASLYSQLSDDNDDISVGSSVDLPPVPDVTDDKYQPNMLKILPTKSQGLGQEGGIDSINNDLLYFESSNISMEKNGELQNLANQGGHRNSGFNNNNFDGQQNDSDLFENTNKVIYTGHNESTESSKLHTNKQNRTTSTSSISSVSSQSFAVYENPVHHSPKHSYSIASEFQLPLNNSTPKSLKDNQQNCVSSQKVLENSSELERTFLSVNSNETVFNVTPITPLTKSVIPTAPDQRLPNPQEIANSQYIFLAAQQISAAQQCEQQKDYHEALNYYREGVGTLLQGVQDDTDGSRREAVRRKTAQYLQRAEQLMSRLTRKEKRNQESEGPAPSLSSSGEVELKCSSLELGRYCVIGTAGSVLIATDTTTGETVAIKVVLKSDIGGADKTILPQRIPFMVPIICYHETDTAILLVLKFISGGKLWDHIGPYVNSVEFEAISGAGGEGLSYIGRRLIEDEDDAETLARNQNTQLETLYSHPSAELQLSSKPPDRPSVPNNSQHLQVNTSTLSQRGASVSSEVSSLAYASESCLQLFSQYTTSLPSSSSMLLPSPSNISNNVNNIVSKSVSASANLLNGKLDDAERDNEATSVGSDTLSGVSDDFSCSLPANTTEGTNGTTEQYFTATDDVPGAQELLIDKKVSDHIPGVVVNKESLGMSKNSSFDDKEDVTEVSFSSTTLPSYSWTERDDDTIADIDIDELIRNSKELLSNVDHTLKQSKNQSVYSAEDSDESTSDEHSELPLDSVTCGFEKNENGSTDKVSDNALVVTSDTKISSHLKCDSSSYIESNHDTHKELRNSYCVSTTSDFEKNVPDLPAILHDKSIQECDEKHNVNEGEQSLIESSLAVLLGKYSNRSQNTQPHLPEQLVKVWVSQIVSAIGGLHNLGIIWQDFDPSNVLLDEGGSILVTYKSRWSSVDCRGKGLGSFHGSNRSHSVAEMSASFLAPELSSPLMCPTAAADWWSVGALMYQLLSGRSLADSHPTGLTSHSELVLPSHLSTEAASLLTQLLAVHPTERLGGGALGVIEIKDHPFFAGVNWQ